jgi:hypothetical protein
MRARIIPLAGWFAHRNRQRSAPRQRPAAELSQERDRDFLRVGAALHGEALVVTHARELVRELVHERARQRPIASACIAVRVEVRRSIAVPLPFPGSGRVVVAHTNADAR